MSEQGRKTGLVLTRREGESVDVRGPMTVTVVRIEGSRVVLRFVADRWVKILRTELEETDE